MGDTGMVLLWQSTLTHRLQWTMFPRDELEEPNSWQTIYYHDIWAPYLLTATHDL